MNSPILAPAAILVLWSLVMLFWMAGTRIPALSKAGINLGTAVGGRGQQLDGVLPDRVNWKAHNYAHLMEQPTIFYAVTVILALAGAGTGLALTFAWTYVALRVAHSIVQATFNRVLIRSALFFASTFALVGMAIIAVGATLQLG